VNNVVLRRRREKREKSKNKGGDGARGKKYGGDIETSKKGKAGT